MSKAFRKILMVLIVVIALVAAYYILMYEPGPAPGRADAVTGGVEGGVRDGQVLLGTWNLYNFGRSKDDAEMRFIAEQIRGLDLVAVQEVSTSQEGVQAVARLDAALDRLGADWDYVVSEATSGTGSERYAYLWKSSKVRLVERPWLDPALAEPLDREPFMARFAELGTGKPFMVASFHAVPTSKKPAREVAYLDALHTRYADDHLFILGDFNLPQRHQAFETLKQYGYAPVLVEQKTSIRMKVKDGEHLASAYDNIFVEAGVIEVRAAGVLDFTRAFETLREARRISDHLPVYVAFTVVGHP